MFQFKKPAAPKTTSIQSEEANEDLALMEAADAAEANTEARPQTGKSRNLVPVDIGDILAADNFPLMVEGTTVDMLTILGVINNITHEASKSIYYIQDYSGSIEVILWKDQVHGHEVFHQGSHVRVIGRARVQGEKKFIAAMRLFVPECKEEIEAHPLEVRYARLKIRQMKQKEAEQAEDFGHE